MKLHPLKYPLRAAAKAICLLAAAALAACSSDEPIDSGKPAPAPDNGMVSVNLALSAPSIETRADDDEEATKIYSAIDTEAKEDVVNNLWVYFFSDSGKLVKAYEASGTYKLEEPGYDPNTNAGAYTNITTTESISLPGGKYRVYVLANLKNYCDTDANQDIAPSAVNGKTGNDALSETDLQGYTFHTATGEDGKDSGVFIGDLPMAAYADAIEIISSKTDGGDDNTIDDDGTITLTKGSLTIQATMTYLCAKIRYSFFFDNTVNDPKDGSAPTYGFSYPLKSMKYNIIGVHNAHTYATLFGGELPTGKNGYTEKNIIDDTTDPSQGCVRVQYPDASTKWKSLDGWIGGDTDIPHKLVHLEKEKDAQGKEIDYPISGQIAYQGYIYISQNLATNVNNKTYLHLKTNLDGSSDVTDYKIYLPDNEDGQVLRGNFYDIIGKITATGISFNVRVKPWVDTPNTTVMPLGL